MSERVTFAENLEDGQLVVRTITHAEFLELDQETQAWGEFGYWLFKWHDGVEEFEPLAKLVHYSNIYDIANGLDQKIIVWREEGVE
jgi:hypothetical protein